MKVSVKNRVKGALLVLLSWAVSTALLTLLIIMLMALGWLGVFLVFAVGMVYVGATMTAGWLQEREVKHDDA